ncbi:uncharacterized protein CIMG_10469 [Coccidioides immitis RS]|uniref:Uncharacterized protein n=1 Tax=Coccidioides immitis (strain RS) TaxID=246410 RepID=A0A0D8JSQ1_COCIM|nr:uncharacterized protein CIMG_10469 [Coccidioides immitis RS]KJF60375.1 hypothetical protein CIMG_10469 [Coccidioides immitis RS]
MCLLEPADEESGDLCGLLLMTILSRESIVILAWLIGRLNPTTSFSRLLSVPSTVPPADFKSGRRRIDPKNLKTIRRWLPVFSAGSTFPRQTIKPKPWTIL